MLSVPSKTLSAEGRSWVVWFLLAWLLLSCPARLFGLEGSLRFDRVTPEDGLSGPEVFGIAQDGMGFIWMVTCEG